MQNTQFARSVRDIESEVSLIERRLQARAAETAPLEQLGSIGAAIASLREAYQRDPRAFERFLPRLTAVRRRFDALLTGRMVEAVDRFHAVSRRLHDTERERDFWRRFIVSQAGSESSIRFEGRDAFVQVRSTTGRSLPPPGSDDRSALEEALNDAGCLPLVSIISPAKLQAAMAAKRIPTEAARVVDELCPPMRRPVVISRSRIEDAETGKSVA